VKDDEGWSGLVDVERRDPTQLPPVLPVVERTSAVHRGAIVPDHEVTDPPGMAVDELRLGRVLRQIAQEQPSLGAGQSTIFAACAARYSERRCERGIARTSG
jgi:hypothetical protein